MRRTFLTLLASICLVATGVVAGHALGGTGTISPPPRIAFLANGINPADAVAAGGIAGQLGAPLFTTGPDALQAAARGGLIAYEPELVIILGGPIAIAESVANEVAAALGLAVTTAVAPTDGIVRVAGENRFETAAAVAELLALYDPAYLPVDATALGAIDAATADDADLLDGLDATAFARSDRSCATGEVATGTGADGDPTCTANVQQLAPITQVVTEFALLVESQAATMTIEQFASNTKVINSGNGPDSVYARLLVGVGDGGSPNLELTTFELCLGVGGENVTQVRLLANDLVSGNTLFSHDTTQPFADRSCTEIELPSAYILDRDIRPTIYVSVDDKTSVEIRAVRLTWTPTSDALPREP